MIKSLQPFIDVLPEPARQRRALERGKYLFRQREPAQAIYAVVSGRVQLFRDLADGSAVTLHVAREGETFAEAALFASHYHCHAQAEVDSVVICLDADTLMRRLQSDAALGVALSRLFAGQVRELRAMLSLRDIRSADERLLTWLRRKADAEHMDVVLDRPWTAISEELGLTREAVYRSLSRLQKQGLIERHGRHGEGSAERIRLGHRS
ncbi:MAG: Crp/Fnr family transcriptional regulator [Pseudomonadota bacterium]